MTLNLLTHYKRETDADCQEKISDVLLYCLRLACGRTIQITASNGTFHLQERTNTITEMALRSLAFLGALILSPLTLAGLSLAYYSSSHEEIANLHERYLSAPLPIFHASTTRTPQYKMTFTSPSMHRKVINSMRSHVPKLANNFQSKTITCPTSSYELKSILLAYCLDEVEEIFPSPFSFPRSSSDRGSAVQTTLSGLHYEELAKESINFLSQKKSAPINVRANPSLSQENIIPYLLEAHQGVVIGEVHSHSFPKEFLREQMQRLKGQGVETLFLEHLPYDTMQSLLDQDFNSMENMPEQLRVYLEQLAINTASSSELNEYAELILAAKRCKIRIVGIETSETLEIAFNLSKYTPFFTPNKEIQEAYLERTAAMNCVAWDIINREKGEGKYLSLVGFAHTVASNVSNYMPGLCDLLQVPHVAIINDSEPGVEWNQRVIFGNTSIFAHAILKD